MERIQKLKDTEDHDTIAQEIRTTMSSFLGSINLTIQAMEKDIDKAQRKTDVINIIQGFYPEYRHFNPLEDFHNLTCPIDTVIEALDYY